MNLKPAGDGGSVPEIFNTMRKTGFSRFAFHSKQRLSILQALNQGPKTHVTAKDVFEQVRQEHPSIGFATVYRFLKKTSDFGITSELRIGHSPARYELKTKKHHHHITCTQCGRIVEFQNEKIEIQIQKITKEHKFSLEHHVFELYGRCQRGNCQRPY